MIPLPKDTQNRNFMLAEDWDDKTDEKFTRETAIPYFKTSFKHLASWSNSAKTVSTSKHFIDNVAFFEYAKLPGILCDRFFSVFERTKEENYILEAQFIYGLMKVFHSSLSEKMKLTFQM